MQPGFPLKRVLLLLVLLPPTLLPAGLLQLLLAARRHPQHLLPTVQETCAAQKVESGE
jgi:hypothetical protein